MARWLEFASNGWKHLAQTLGHFFWGTAILTVCAMPYAFSNTNFMVIDKQRESVDQGNSLPVRHYGYGFDRPSKQSDGHPARLEP